MKTRKPSNPVAAPVPVERGHETPRDRTGSFVRRRVARHGQVARVVCMGVFLAPVSGSARPWAEALADGAPPIEELAPWVTPAPEIVPPRRLPESAAFEWRGNLQVPVASDRLSDGARVRRGVDHPPTPSILFIEFGEVTLKTNNAGCPTDGGAHAAKRCSSLVNRTTTFPGWGTGSERAAVFDTLRRHYAPFNVVLTVNEPPEYVPYSMAVASGTPELVDLSSGICGVATLACDAAKRNHVSLSFADRCGGRAADVIAQESAHNFGLEHTDDSADIMYPSVTGGTNTFVNRCMDIVASDNTIVCGSTHDAYCEGGMGKKQNSKAELLGVFGPREVDETAPKIVSITPEDGAYFRTTDSIPVTVTVDENTPFLGVRWTWTKGAPPQKNDDVYSACTNGMCRLEFDDWRDNKEPYPFVTLNKPPAGTYAFKFEAMDAYGNSVTKTVEIEVLEPGAPIPEPKPSDTTDGGGSASTGDGDGSGTTGDRGTTRASGSEPTGGTDAGPAAEDTGGSAGNEIDKGSGCACGVPAGGPGMPLGVGVFALAALGLGRGRSPRSRSARRAESSGAKDRLGSLPC